MPHLRQRSPRSSNVPSFLKARAKAQSPVRQSASPPVRQSASSNFLEPDGGFEIFCNIFLSKLSLASSPQHKHLAAATLPSTSPSRKGLPIWSTPLAWGAAPLLAALLVFAPAPAAALKCYSGAYNSRNLADCTSLHLSGDLSGNNLSSLPEGVFDGLSNLETLWLDGNNLSSLPEGVFDGLSNLQELWLHGNNLSSLPEGVFDGLSNLETLRLDGNNLSSLPEGVFDGLSNLQELWLDYNNLSSLPEGVFDGLSNLQELWLDYNNLSSLPEGVFDGLSNLQELRLDYNNLSSLPEGVFDGLSNLQELRLDYNNLSSLPEGVFDGLSNLEELWLGGDNLSCRPNLPGGVEVYGVSGLPLCDGPGQEEPDQGQQPGDGDGGQTGGGQQPGQEEPDQGQQPGDGDGGQTGGGQQPGQEEPDQGQQPGDGDGGQTGGGQQPGQEEPDQGQQPGYGDGGQTGGGQQPGQEEPDQGQQPGDGGEQPGDGQQPREQEDQSLLDKYRGELDAAEGLAKEEAIERAVEKAVASELGEKVLGKKLLQKGLGRLIPLVGFVGDVKSIVELGAIQADIIRTNRRVRQMQRQNRRLEAELQQKQQEQGLEPIQIETDGQTIETYDPEAQIIRPSQPGAGDQSNSSFGELFNDLATTLYLHQDALQNGSLSLAQAFSNQEFAYPFSLAQGGSEEEGTNAQSFNALFTGSVDFSRFSDNSGDSDLDGATTTYRLGLNVLPRPEVPLLTGVQLAFTNTNVDFQDEEIDTDGDYGLRLFSLSPFVAWDATDQLTLQASIGYGRGETTVSIDSIADGQFDFIEGSSNTDNGEFFSVAAGANLRVWESDASALTLQVGGSTVSFLDATSKQGRVAAQFSHDFPLNSGRLRSAANLAWLLSDGDPSVMELSGALNWLPDQGRLSGSTSARVLLFGEDHSEWGISGGLALRPGQQGEGLSLSLQPSFGQADASLAGLEGMDAWDRYNDLADLALNPEPLTARFHAEVAYGFRRPHALLTPYTQLNMAHSSTTTSAGLRYALDTSLDLDLSASHRSRSSGNNESRVFLQLRSDL